MRPKPAFRSLGRLLLPLLLVVWALLAGLGWLGWRVLEQDRTLERQRVLDRLGTGADLFATALTGRLVELGDRLAEIDAAPEPQQGERARAIVESPADGSVILSFRRGRVDAFPPEALLYYPLAPSSSRPHPTLFARGDDLEFRQRHYAGAAAFYRNTARSTDRTIRAEALIRLARTLRKSNRQDEALAVYTQLTGLAPAWVDDVPVDLMAMHARCVLFEELRRAEPLRAEAAALHGGLARSRWQLTEGAYHFYLDQARRWLDGESDNEPAPKDALAIAACASALWRDWQEGRFDGDRAVRRRSEWVRDRPLLVAWRGSGERLVAFVAAAAFLEREWLSPLQPASRRLNLQIALADTDGHAVYGTPSGHQESRVVRSTAETELPWTLHVAVADRAADLAQLSARRRFVLAGFGLTAVLIGVASYVTARAVARELAVARLQSDFVSAVSHEFRTPLATMRQMSELLADGRVPGDERRQQYYEDLRHESERLNRLVENLLDFGRMEAGAREYRFEIVDTPVFVRGVAEEFAQEVAERGYRVEVAADDDLPLVRADQEALGRALWNLLDNAVKYSPDAKTVWIEARGGTGRVVLSVRDQGFGISADERRRIFDKFVRGTSAKAAGVKGTGLGLAMVQRIVTAHGGEVGVTSEEGKGSTFTIALPGIRNRESGIRVEPPCQSPNPGS